jgi:hypothetical protein
MAVLLRNSGFGRVKVLGLALAAGALPGLALCLIADAVAGRVFGDSVFGEDLGSVVSSIFDVPVRNFLIVSALGILLAVLGIVFTAIARRFDSDEGEPGYEEAIIGAPGHPTGRREY